jgi:homocysteine S-methyltransferase
VSNTAAATPLWLADGGIETDLIFHRGCRLPEFAAFVLLDADDGIDALRDYYLPYLQLAGEAGTGLVLETPTWRASTGWGALLGYDPSGLAAINRRSVDLLAGLRAAVPTGGTVEISGCLGPLPDGARTAGTLTAAQAQRYHAPQLEALSEAGADRVTAMTISDPVEAVGIVAAARAAGVPVVISLTVETDGRLADETPLGEAISLIDAQSSGGPDYYMLNCAHPEFIGRALRDSGEQARRVHGIRPNASRRTHAQLDAATDLDEGNADEFGAQSRELRARFPALRVLGGCCGTDIAHIRAIAGWTPSTAVSPFDPSDS